VPLEAPCLAVVPAAVLDLPPAGSAAIAVGRGPVLEDDSLELARHDRQRERLGRLSGNKARRRDAGTGRLAVTAGFRQPIASGSAWCGGWFCLLAAALLPQRPTPVGGTTRGSGATPGAGTIARIANQADVTAPPRGTHERPCDSQCLRPDPPYGLNQPPGPPSELITILPGMPMSSALTNDPPSPGRGFT
jgi:hypothetical protein